MAFIPLSPGAAAGGEKLLVEIRPAAGAGGRPVLEVQGKDRSADELQLICKRELENHPDLAFVFRIDARSPYETFYAALSACYNADVSAVTLEVFEKSGGAEKPSLSLPFRMPPKPGTDGRPAGFRPEAHVRLYREEGRTVAYAFGHEKIEPGAALKTVVAEGLKTAGDDVTLVLRAERDAPCGDVLAAYGVCREAGAGRVAFTRAW